MVGEPVSFHLPLTGAFQVSNAVMALALDVREIESSGMMIALGADSVLLGRAFVYALAAHGEAAQCAALFFDDVALPPRLGRGPASC